MLIAENRSPNQPLRPALQKSATESLPETQDTHDAEAVSRCPYLASQERLRQAAALVKKEEAPKPNGPSATSAHSAATTAAGATNGPSTLALAKCLGLEFRAKGRGLDFWRTKWKEISPEKAIQKASKFDAVQGRSGSGAWSPVGSVEDLQDLILTAEKFARADAAKATGKAGAEGVAHSMSGCPFAALTTHTEGAPKKLGLLEFARGMLRHYDNPVGFMREFHAKHGQSFTVNTPTHGKFLFDTRTDILTEALAQTDGREDKWQKSKLQTHGAAFLIGDKNMFASGGDDWHAIREGISPHLGAKKIRSEETTAKLTNIFDDHINDLKARVAAAPGGKLEVDARSEMQAAVLDVALQLFLSTKLPKEELRQLQSAFNTQMSALPEETVNPTKISLSKLPGQGDLKNAYETLDAVADRILTERKNAPEKPGDMLDSFMEAVDPQTGKPFSDERVKHEILSLLEAGHETTATMLGWSLMMMSHNPQEYKALQTDVDQLVGKGNPTPDQLRDLNRADNIVKETLRLYPPFYLFMREAKEDTVLGGPGHEIKVDKGTTLVSSLYESNRDESTWGEESTGFPANEFHSERFEGKPPERFIPFGAGKRSCAGRVLGMLEGNLMLTRMAQTFDIMPDHAAIRTQSDLSIHPEQGKITLQLR